MNKIILLVLIALMMVGCDMPMDTLNVVNGSKFVVTSKRKEEQIYLYHIIKVNNSWYTYNYRDTTNFEVGDTLTITVSSEKTAAKGIERLTNE